MAYEVTATRKRPQVFEKLVGQEFVVSTIENAIESGRIAHAYLFSGPRGVGKTSSARLLAKALNCSNGPTSHPCGVCDSCQKITKGFSTDVIEIDGASNTSVNDIRVIKDEILFPPQYSRYKIYIIDEVHMLSTSAFNALLKTIEEPPEYIIFIFATTELQKVPATIRSRCQQFYFQLIGLETIKRSLREASEEMNILADEDALFWIAREGHGSMRDAYTLFDQVAAFSQNHITLQKIKDKLGLVSNDQIIKIITSAIYQDTKSAIEELSTILYSGISIEQVIKDLTGFFRALLLLKQGIVNEEILNFRKEELPEDLVSLLSATQIEAALRSLLVLYREIKTSLSPQYEVELFLSRLSSLPNLTSLEDLVKKLDSIKSDVTSGKVTVVKEKSIAIQRVTTANVEQKVDEVVKKEDIKKEVKPVVEEKRSVKSPTMEDIRVLIQDSRCNDIFSLPNALSKIYAVEIKDNSLFLLLEAKMAASLINENIKLIQTILNEMTGYEGAIKAIVVEKPKAYVNPKLEMIAKSFRGSVITQNDN